VERADMIGIVKDIDTNDDRNEISSESEGQLAK
jgi:hypothetical protein